MIRGLQHVAPSVLTFTVQGMESDDIVDPGDAAIQALLDLTAQNNHDDHQRDMLMDFILTAPPLAEWPPDWREILFKTGQSIRRLAEDLRRRGEIHDGGDKCYN